MIQGGQSVLVIGYGNEARGDDAVGPQTARRIAHQSPVGVEAIAVHQLTPELAEPISLAGKVIFVDARPASDGDAQAPRVSVGPITADEAHELRSHRIDPAALLMLAKLLFGRCPPAWMVTIAASSFEPLAPLSAEALRGVDEAAVQIMALMDIEKPLGLA